MCRPKPPHGLHDVSHREWFKMRTFPCPYLEGEVELTDEREAHRLTFQYDREADILYINTVVPYAAQESVELGDEIIARLNPQTGKIENLEVLFFTSRLLRKELFSLPVIADLQQAELAYA
jgi:uncharacterized protein YuzE